MSHYKKVLIASMGINPIKSRYTFENGYKYPEDENYEEFFIVPLVAYLKSISIELEKLIMFLTDDAQKSWKEHKLEDKIKGIYPNLDVKTQIIPSGATEEEAKEIFERITTRLKQEFYEIYLDLTGGFRTVPTLLLSSLRYLESATTFLGQQKVIVKKVFYASLETKAKKKTSSETELSLKTETSSKTEISPKTEIALGTVYTLDRVIELLDWANAVQNFKQTGSTAQLAEILKKYESTDASATDLAEKLVKLSEALDFIRPYEVAVKAHDALNSLKTFEDNLKKRAWVEPFEIVLDELEKQINALSLELSEQLSELKKDDWVKFLSMQVKLMKFYFNNKRWLALGILMREFVISWALLNCGYAGQDMLTKDNRKLEKVYNRAAQIPNDVLEKWETLPDMRNDFAHCGMVENSKNSDVLLAQLKEFYEILLAAYQSQPAITQIHQKKK